MSESKAGARPSQVTMAGWGAVLGSGLLVLTLFEAISKVRSITMRDSIDTFLSSPPGNGLGITAAEAVGILRGLMLFSGAVAAAATVLAVYVLQRHNAARIGFTVAAALMLITAPVSGGVLPIMIAAAATMLWTKPARDWFAGRPPVPAKADNAAVLSQESAPTGPDQNPPTGPDQSPDTSGSPPGWPRMPDPEQGTDRPLPPPTQGFGNPSAAAQHPDQAPPDPSWPPPAHGQQPVGHAGYPPIPAHGRPTDPGRRPSTVTVACALTWLFAGVTTFAYVVVVAMMMFAKDQLVTIVEHDPQFNNLNISTNDLMAALWVMSAVVVFWCLVAALLAFFAFRRANWARITLVVSAAVATLVSIAAFPLGILHMIAAIAAIVLLFTGGAGAWYSHQTTPRGHAPSQPPGEKDPPTNVW